MVTISFDNNIENNVWSLEHNAGKLQEIQNRIMQRIMSISIPTVEVLQVPFSGVLALLTSAKSVFVHPYVYLLLIHCLFN